MEKIKGIIEGAKSGWNKMDKTKRTTMVVLTDRRQKAF